MGDDEISAHFIHEINTKGYDVIGVNVFHSDEIPPPKRQIIRSLYTSVFQEYPVRVICVVLSRSCSLKNSLFQAIR